MAVLTALSGQNTFTSKDCGKAPRKRQTIELPTAILSVSGIYDFPLLHSSNPGKGYEDLTDNAIPDPKDQELTSPARYSMQDYLDSWADGGKTRRALVLAHSKDDGLVDWNQVEAMRDVFAGVQDGEGHQNAANEAIRVGGILELKGRHDDIWRTGAELARVIRLAVKVMRDLDHNEGNAC
jgi:hypothetical protein